MRQPAQQLISTILKHDVKVTSYKIALLRAINDIALAFLDLRRLHRPIAIPLRLLAEYWVAYYWPFVDPDAPILQGPRAGNRQDMAFRADLAELRRLWEWQWSAKARPAEGFFLIDDMRVARRRDALSQHMRELYLRALKSIQRTIEMPIRYAGPGEWTVFDRPARLDQLPPSVAAIPGTHPHDRCLVVSPELWQAFIEISLYVEALCLHEWCLFTETVRQAEGRSADRGAIYRMLTDRPDSRRPLTWERNNIDLLIMEGREFVCPWTEKPIGPGVSYEVDHLLPVSVYPINELWNLVPSDPAFNSRVKRNRLPSPTRLDRAEPHLATAYAHYDSTQPLGQSLRDDVAGLFAGVVPARTDFARVVASLVVSYIDQVADSRSLARF